MIFESKKINKDYEKEASKFLTKRIYLQRTIVNSKNISSHKVTSEPLIQIPEGSIPADSEKYNIIKTIIKIIIKTSHSSKNLFNDRIY